MANNIIAVKGTHDMIGEEASCYTYIQNVFKAVAGLYGFQPIDTPVMEYTECFLRSTGESSDVVRKEMYTFLDKGDRSITLRPELTAGVARCIVEKKLLSTSDLPLKLYYSGPVFRYERPQLGRYRQFLQAGVECVGMDSPWLDAETIALAMRTLTYLGFKGVKVKVNTLGDKNSRDAYKEALKKYFEPHLEDMCDDCKKRYELNPLRILDCKVEADQKLVAGAPRMKDFLTKEAEERFYKTLSILNEEGIEYEIDDTLVRGLDYYGHIVFEIHVSSPSGADYGAVMGGGHYDGLLSSFGGKIDSDNGVGFAFGVERLYSLMRDFGLLEGVSETLDVYMMPLSEDYIEHGFVLAEQIRGLGYTVEMPYNKAKLGSLFKKANRKKAKVAVIFGEDEILNGVVQVKNLATEEQIEAPIETLDRTLASILEEEEEGHHHCCCHDGEEEGEHCCRHGHHEEGEEHHCCHDDGGDDDHCCHKHDEPEEDYHCCHHKNGKKED